MTLDEYTRQTADLLKRRYGLELNDFDLTPEVLQDALDQGDTPEEIVSWFGSKYDLTPIEEFSFIPRRS